MKHAFRFFLVVALGDKRGEKVTALLNQLITDSERIMK